MDRDGANQTQLTTIAWDYQPAWSPDGTKIAFMSDRAPPLTTPTFTL
jgi:Tol biopolymer transport system component